ncbi:MAG: RNA polymerase factor sigma-54 [Candidatus Omnitrophota bacterium]
MKLRQTQKLSQVLSLTPQMRQSLRVLQLPLLELRSFLENQLEENPVLEQEERDEEAHLLRERLERIMEADERRQEDLAGNSPDEVQRKRDYKESIISVSEDPREHLLKQVRMSHLSKKRLIIAEFIIGNLDKNGYLSMETDEILFHCRKMIPANEKAVEKDIEDVLSMIHMFDPPGIAARNLKECLLIQLRLKKRQDSLAYKIISGHLAGLTANKIKNIAKKLKVSEREVNKARKEISRLEPKPGRYFSPSVTQQISPLSIDVIVEDVDGRYDVLVNSAGMPRLKVNSYYIDLLKSGNVPSDAKEYIREKIRDASGLLKALSQREETIRRIAEIIVTMQRDFMEQNDVALLKPITLKDVAKIVGRNESTISRVVSNKYIKTPFGVYRFDYFFTRVLKTDRGENIPQESVKQRMRDLVGDEDPAAPLRDSALVTLLRKEGIRIARRTVAKYREELKILPYHQRKKNPS